MNYFNYFSEIEETFIRRRGKSLLLSPLDWTLIESWQKRGIPQHVVIRSVEKVFDEIARDPKRNPNIKSIAYCSDEVERQYKDWLGSQAGNSELAETADDDHSHDTEIAEHIASLIEAVAAAAGAENKETLGPVLAETSETLQKLAAKKDLGSEKIEQELSEMEIAIDRVLLDTARPEHLAEARNAVQAHLSQYAGKMQPDVYEKTFELMVLKKLREKAGIPAFSLFYL